MIWTNQSTETGLIWTKQWTVTALEGELRGGGWRSPQHLPGHGYSGKGRVTVTVVSVVAYCLQWSLVV